MSVITVSVKDKQFGAIGNGKHNDGAAIQKAMDYLAAKIANTSNTGLLNIPAGTYIVTSPIFHRSNITMLGASGNRSIIKNTVKSPTGAAQFCIYIGNFAPNDYTGSPHYNIQDITAGDTSVILTKTADKINFSVGQAVLIDSVAGFMSGDGVHWKPYKAFINRITDINTTTGVITLEDAVTTDIIGAQIAPTNKLGSKIYICQRPVIRSMRFESFGNWTERFGVYKGLFDDIYVKTTDVIGGNGFSGCTFTNIKGQFSQKVIEMAMYSHNSIVDGMNVTWWDGKVDPTMKPLLKMGENMRDCAFTNLTIDAGNGKYFGTAIRFEHAFNNRISNATFKGQAIAEIGIEIDAEDENAFVIDNQVDNCIFKLGNTDSYIKLENDTDEANMTGNIIMDNTFSGGTRKDEVVTIGDVSGNTIIPNTFL